jgi:hypothetical protein
METLFIEISVFKSQLTGKPLTVIEQNSAQAEIETMIRKREIFHGMDKLDINVVGLDVKPVRMYDVIVYFTDRVVPLCIVETSRCFEVPCVGIVSENNGKYFFDKFSVK